MLIEFSVTNYRSIREKQSLSMVADNSAELRDGNTFKSAKAVRFLPCAVIYGANASGKSNLIKAMRVMRDLVLNSADRGQEGQTIKSIVPHALATDEPTEFEVIFISENIRYQYGFSVTKEKIIEEWLFVSPKNRAQTWLLRDINDQEKPWYINPTQVKGDKALWQRSTRNNALFVSTAAQLNSTQFKQILTWFQFNLIGGKSTTISPVNTLKVCEEEQGQQTILDFLNMADFSISALEHTEKEMTFADLSDDLPIAVRKQLWQKLQDTNDNDSPLKQVKIKFVHSTESGETFSLKTDEESDGTQRIFEIAGIWQKVLEKGYVLLVDELNDSLHPTLLRHLVSLFNSAKYNPNHAQLIFTTHDTSVLDKDLLRRDQVWFIEKDKNQNSALYPLSDFKPRKSEALQKNYLQGRYGALPYISQLFE